MSDDRDNEPQGMERRSMEARAVVRTHAVKVSVFMRNGAQVDGLAHIKPGAYQRRVSDLLNLGKVKYIALTDVTYVLPDTTERSSECVLVNLDDIVMMDVASPENA